MIALEEAIFAGTNDAESFLLPEWTPLADELLLLFVFRRAELIVPAVAGNSLTWVEIANVANVQGQNGMTLLRSMGSAPATGQIEVTLADNLLPANAIAMRLSGVDPGGVNGSGAIEAVSVNEGPVVDNNDLQGTVTILSNHAWAIMGATYRNRTFTWPADQTLIEATQNGAGGDTTKSTVIYKEVSPVGTVTLGGENSLNSEIDWCSITVGIRPAVEFFVIQETPRSCPAGLRYGNAKGVGYKLSSCYGQYVS